VPANPDGVAVTVDQLPRRWAPLDEGERRRAVRVVLGKRPEQGPDRDAQRLAREVVSVGVLGLPLGKCLRHGTIEVVVVDGECAPVGIQEALDVLLGM
jgi:hypothetical protein